MKWARVHIVRSLNVTLRPGVEVDGKVHTFDEHEDSVYGLSWSPVDPWIFTTLSYDGRVVVNHVPKQVKYRVQLG